MSADPQLELEAQAEAPGYQWSELGPFDMNARYIGPGGGIAALVFAARHGRYGQEWLAVLYTLRGPVSDGELGPFDTLELAQGAAEAEAERRGLLSQPSVERGRCCACGHYRCGTCT